MKALMVVLSLFVSVPTFAEAVKVSVNGMVCAFCAQGLKKSFTKVTAVESVEVDLDKKLVTLRLKKDQALEDEKIRALIKDSGYETVAIERVK